MSLWGPRDPEAEARVREMLEEALRDAPPWSPTPEEVEDLRRKVEEAGRPYRTGVSLETLETVLD